VVDKFYVEASAIHGLGLFARELISAGEVIGAIAPQPVAEDGPHVLWLSEDEGHQVEGPLRFINHSPQPNACYYDDLTVVALTDIAPGVEITHDYGDGW
jgi:hypothetical protein